MKISYAITVCNELKEITELLDFLIVKIRDNDEIVVQYDEGNATRKVIEFINRKSTQESIKGRIEFKVVGFPLNDHFAKFKNNIKNNCTGDYIFQIDADEMPNIQFIDDLPTLLLNNMDTDVFLVPRINTVKGLTKKHIQKWGWNVSDDERINWPDHQWRLWKNKPNIKWVNKVHEVLEGHDNYSTLPSIEEWALYHKKDIKKQEKQNNYYNKLT